LLARAIQRLEKVLQDAEIKPTSVASRTNSVSARAMLEALGRVRDPACLGELAKARLRRRLPQLTEALANPFDTAHHGALVAGLLARAGALG
jgi:transposase